MVPYLHVTTRIEGRKDENLFREIGGTGFPTIKFMDAEGSVLGEPGGRDVAAFDETLGTLMELAELEKRIEAGEEGLEDDLFMAKLRMGAYSFEDAKANAAKFKELTAEEKKEVAQILVNLEIESIMSGIDSQEAAEAATQTFLAWLEKGKIPTGDALGNFWGMIMEHAEAKKDVKLFTKALKGLEEEYGHIEQAKSFFDAKKAVLKEMKAEHEEVVEETVEEQIES
ncbi:MAG: hypothetical protein ACYSU1_02575 [Planctomycetota bacterium]